MVAGVPESLLSLPLHVPQPRYKISVPGPKSHMAPGLFKELASALLIEPDLVSKPFADP